MMLKSKAKIDSTVRESALSDLLDKKYISDEVLDALMNDAEQYRTLISLGQPHPAVDALSKEGLLKAIYIPALIAEVRELREQV